MYAIRSYYVEKGTPLPWGCFMRPKHVTRELLTLMKRAGLKHVEFGSDSMSDPVLEAYQKGFSFEDIRVSSLLAKEVGIDFCHFIIFGGPGETEATMQETFENSKQISGAIIFLLLYLNFKNITESMIVMLSVPFSLTGGLWLMDLMGYRNNFV